MLDENQKPSVEETHVETEDTDIDLEALNQESDVEKLREQLRTTVEQKKHWREKHGKLSEDPRLKPVEKPVPVPKKKENVIDPDTMRSEIIDELRTQQKYDLSEVELKKAKALASIEGKNLSEVVEDQYFQGYMSANRAAAAKEKARPDSSNRGGNGGGYSVDDLSDPVKVARMDSDTFAKLSDQAGKR